MNQEWKDISVPLYNDMVHWPGDQDFYSERIWDIKKGSPCNVSLISMCSHTGTHMDPPLHFLKKGKSLDKLPLTAAIGPARVIEIKARQCIGISELKKHKLKKGERILFKTLNSRRCCKKDRFVEDFVYISKEAAEYLAEIRIKVIGIDYLSVGGFVKDNLETHQSLLKAGIWIIEGLDLSGIKPGNYELICLPLKILNSDGAPARAVLRKI
jgi:arylformamidase